MKETGNKMWEIMVTIFGLGLAGLIIWILVLLIKALQKYIAS